MANERPPASTDPPKAHIWVAAQIALLENKTQPTAKSQGNMVLNYSTQAATESQVNEIVLRLGLLPQEFHQRLQPVITGHDVLDQEESPILMERGATTSLR